MSTTSITPSPAVLALTTGIVSAYVAKNHLPASELPGLVGTVYGALSGLATGTAPQAAETAPTALTPAQIRKSITPDALISFIDGKPYKTLKRHLTAYQLSPALYRERFGLPGDYPMVCASYSATRSKLAIGIGLGQRRQAAE